MFIGWQSVKEFECVKEGKSKDPNEILRFLHLQSLVEQNEAHWEPEDAPLGCLMEADQGCFLSDELKKLLLFPPQWSGRIKLNAPYATHEVKFTASLEMVLPNGSTTKIWNRKGSILFVSNHQEFTLSPQELQAILAYEQWHEIPKAERNEADHQILIANLQKASQDVVQEDSDDPIDEPILHNGAKIDIGFGDLEFGNEEWEISVIETPDGGLRLVPTPQSQNSIKPEEILKRFKQFKYGGDQATLRLNKKIITLSKTETNRARDLIQNGRLNADQKKKFIENPTNYLAEYVFNPDDVEWSPRVKGIMEWTGSKSESAVDGGMGMETLSVEKREQESNQDVEGNEPDIDSPTDSNQANRNNFLPYPHLNIENDEFSECLAKDRIQWGVDHPNVISQKLDFSVFLPSIALKSHQELGVQWMQAHSEAIESTAMEETTTGKHFDKKRGGVLLADDMGLGKTISVLAYMSMRQKALMEQNKSGAYLVIAPVSLLLNWQDELEKFFSHKDIFKQVIILHTDHELNAFRSAPNSIDEIVESPDDESIKIKTLGLRINNTGEAQGIDQPGNIVFTNYETVQRFRFSMCAAKWEVIALDEAQATKNPSIMRTATVKALDAKFRILMTGTPVENSLIDFWCLNDTHSPGLLCPLTEFKKNFIARITRAQANDSETRKEVAEEIKTLVGQTMLRRMKHDIFDKNFPKKIEHHFNSEPLLATFMAGDQLIKYDSIRLRHCDAETNDHHLALLYQLRLCSLHPDLEQGEGLPVGADAAEATQIISRSIKGKLLLDSILPKINNAGAGEKVLIFALTKNLQTGLARNLEKIYPKLGRIPIINGDTKIKSSKKNPSRQKLIEEFENKKGFHICILSPVAAGVGLTITAANHVVHFERHWNPAKEAQATDRAYRIGQEKDVHVWYPLAIHPDEGVVSFDSALNLLMARKVQLQDNILCVEDTTIGKKEVLPQILGTQKSKDTVWQNEQLKRLSPLEFEALIACLYEKSGASKCELTKQTGDKGADIIAYDYPEEGDNTLIDAKHTTTNKPLSSSEGIKQISHAQNQYQAAIGKTFNNLQVVTNRGSAISRIIKEAQNSNVEIVCFDEIENLLQNYQVSEIDIERKLREKRVSI